MGTACHCSWTIEGLSKFLLEDWTVDDVCIYLSSIGLNQWEEKIRKNNTTGQILIDLVDEPLSTITQMFGIDNAEARNLREILRALSLQNKGILEELGREQKEEMAAEDDADGILKSDFAESKAALEETRLKRINVVAVGKTGQGKSTTLNTILHYNGPPGEQFEEVSGLQSGTKTVDQHQINIKGVDVRLVDTMGLFDTDDPDDVVMNELARTIHLCSDGIHAFIIAVKLNERLTDESRRTIDIIRQYFGTHLLKYAFIVMTGADIISDPQQQRTQANSLLKYTQMQLPDSKIHFFNNPSRDPGQVERLMDEIVANATALNGPYTNAAFEVAQLEMQRAIEEERKKAELERQEMIDNATKHVREQHKQELVELEERFRSDHEALQAELVRQRHEAVRAIRAGEERAEKRYQEQITQIMRQHENALASHHSQQVQELLDQQAQMKSTFEKQIRELTDSYEKRIQDQRLSTNASQARQQKQFEQLLNSVGTKHKDEITGILAKTTAEAKQRQEKERQIIDQLNQEIARAVEVAKNEKEREEAEAKQREKDSSGGLAMHQLRFTAELQRLRHKKRLMTDATHKIIRKDKNDNHLQRMLEAAQERHKEQMSKLEEQLEADAREKRRLDEEFESRLDASMNAQRLQALHLEREHTAQMAKMHRDREPTATPLLAPTLPFQAPSTLMRPSGFWQGVGSPALGLPGAQPFLPAVFSQGPRPRAVAPLQTSVLRGLGSGFATGQENQQCNMQ